VRGYDNSAKQGKDHEYNMMKTFEHNGLSITISSLTNVIGFASGYLSSIDSIRSFGIFAAIGICMVFFNAMTLFGGILSYDARRQIAD